MKVVAINSSNTGSTGSIMKGIAKIARERGHLYYTACPKGRTMSKEQDPYHLFIGSILGRNLHILLGMLSGCPGFFSVIETLAARVSDSAVMTGAVLSDTSSIRIR